MWAKGKEEKSLPNLFCLYAREREHTFTLGGGIEEGKVREIEEGGKYSGHLFPPEKVGKQLGMNGALLYVRYVPCFTGKLFFS